MTYFWIQDFKPSRTLRFMLSTFLSQLRAHPAIVDSDRDTRIIRNLRNVFKKQRKLHLSEDVQISSSRESAINIHENDTIAEDFEIRRDDRLQSTKDTREDSAIGMPPSHHKHSISLDNTREPKPSLSTPVVPILKRSRRMSENSQRGVNDSNEWAARLTFGLRSVKRTVPAMYRSLVEGFVGNNTSYNTCKCDDFRRESGISHSSDDMMDLRSYKSNTSISATLNASYRSRRVGKSSSHIEKSSENELRLYAPRPRPSQSLTEPPRNYSEFSTGSDMYQQPHPNPACPYHLSISPPNVASPPNISYVPSTASKAKSFSTDMESSIHSGFRIDTQSNITPRYPQKSFILQHRSEVIMQQFCIIEKELLERVTWVEIVEMRWKKTRAPVSQRSGEGNGSASNVLDCNIDAVIEWFNITYIWVISEIVSIQSLEIRVQVIEKFIRIALVSVMGKKKK
jgi:RasGEF domain